MEGKPTTFGHGLVIGKFYPPHRGHEFLIGRALEQSARVTVIVCGRDGERPTGDLRREWLQELFPQVEIRLIEDHYDATDSKLWADLTLGWLGKAPNAVFTSENYGDAYARYLGCVHVKVDGPRAKVPCSGTAIRQAPLAHWEFLSPPVRAWYALRVCVLGAESTGTTTLARALAEHFRTEWVPEYGREYSEAKLARGESEWRTAEFEHVAGEQNRREDAAARRSGPVLVCDTNSFATTLWHRRYVGQTSDAVARLAAQRPCALYLLTGDEIPFVQDGTRDGEHIRHTMHGWFEETLAAQPVPWLLVRGSHEERMKMAIGAIEPLLAGQSCRAGITPGS